MKTKREPEYINGPFYQAGHAEIYTAIEQNKAAIADLAKTVSLILKCLCRDSKMNLSFESLEHRSSREEHIVYTGQEKSKKHMVSKGILDEPKPKAKKPKSKPKR